MTHDYHDQTATYQAFLFERLYRATRSRLVKIIFVSTMGLLFLLPLYDLITGNLSSLLMTLLIISTLLLIYVYVVICMIGKWNRHKHLMVLPRSYIIGLMILFASCIISLYRDFFVQPDIRIYLFPLSIALVILIVASVHYIRMRIKAKKLSSMG